MNEDWNGVAKRFLAAWTSQDVDAVLATYTEDLVYRDPNTRGEIRGANAMRRYLTRLFGAWEMTWSLREAHVSAEGTGAVLWHATFRPRGGGAPVEADGMDLVQVRGGRVARNEVQFDRTLLGATAAVAG